MPGGVAQVRNCTDALVGMAKEEGITVVMTGHVTKDGDLAGPRALEHAVDVVLLFEGDARSGLRVLSGGKNRFGAEGESAWFEMGADGLREIDPAGVLLDGRAACPGRPSPSPWPGDGPSRSRSRRSWGRSTALPAVRPPGSMRAGSSSWRPCSLAPAGYRLGRAELFGASSGGLRVDDPAADLAVAAALASAVSGVPTPEGAAFVGEVSLTGLVRQASAHAAAARRRRGGRMSIRLRRPWSGRTAASLDWSPFGMCRRRSRGPATAVRQSRRRAS